MNIWPATYVTRANLFTTALFAIILCVALSVRPARALNVTTSDPNATLIWGPGSTNFDYHGSSSGFIGCPAQNLMVCGITYNMPMTGRGAAFSYNLPGRFVAPAFTLRCLQTLTSGLISTYVIDAPNGIDKLCALKPCTPGPVDVCDHHFTIDATTPSGDTVTLPVPQTLLEDLHGNPEPTFTAQCIGDGDTTRYVVQDTRSVSCSNFLCSPTTLPVCGTTATVGTSSVIGSVGQIATATGQMVTVSCLGSGGHAPQYVITDNFCH